MRLEREPMTPKDMMQRAYWISLVWTAGAIGATIRGDDEWVMLYLALVNLWVAVIFLARYLSRTIR